MRGWLGALGLVCGWTGAVLWAVAVTVLQPMTEPVDWAENNTYWVRDVRWMAILLVFAALILAVRGNRIRSGLAALGVAAWLGVDLWLDRIDVAGSNSTKWAAALGCLVVAAAFLAERLAPGKPDPRVLNVAAGMAAATVPMAVLIESPTDTEAALTPSALALGFLLTAVALGCAVSAAAAPAVRNIVLAVGIAVAAGGLMVLVRIVPIDVRLLLLFPLVAVLVTGVAAACWPWPGLARAVARYSGLSLAVPFVYMAFTFPLFLYLVPVGAWLTDIAANPPVNEADFDSIRALYGLPVGLLFGMVLIEGREHAQSWFPENRPARPREPVG